MRFIKTFFGIVLCICAIGFISATAQVEAAMRPFFIVLVCLCVVGAVLLLKRPKRQKVQPKTPPVVSQGEFVSVQAELVPDEVPEDIAKEMRKYYTAMQAQRDMEIMAESYKIASTTLEIRTFCMRYDLALQKAHTLLQAEQVGVKGLKKLNFHDACTAVIEAAPALRLRGIHDCAAAAIGQAEALKTDRGKYNRYTQKILTEFERAEPTLGFMDEYIMLMEKIRERIAQLETTQK